MRRISLRAVLLAACLALELTPGLVRADEPAAGGMDLGGDAAGDAAPDAAIKGFQTLYRFTGKKDGSSPRGGVLYYRGAVYGTTQADANCPTCGTLFKLTPARGSWKIAILHRFGNETFTDGMTPQAPLVNFGTTLYGTTFEGANPLCGCGEVFRFKLPGTYDKMKFSGPDGMNPEAGLLAAKNGTLYGTTTAGGKHRAGVVFKIAPSGKRSTLYDFHGAQNGGPQGELVFGKDGAIYGTTYGAGAHNQGMVFRLTTAGRFQDLHDFHYNYGATAVSDGAYPQGRLAVARNGNIYGITQGGGDPSGYGTAWSLVRLASGKYHYQQIFVFGSPNEANTPHSGFVIDGHGVLYGTAAGGGTSGGGVIYKLKQTSPGNWTYTTLHEFKPLSTGGDIPFADIQLVGSVLYGSALTGGRPNSDCCGTVWRFGL